MTVKQKYKMLVIKGNNMRWIWKITDKIQVNGYKINFVLWNTSSGIQILEI